MLAEERRQGILDLLHQQGSARTIELARRFNVSDQTIRRDLQELDDLGLITKSHGGGTLVTWRGASFGDRTLATREEKRAIAEAAARLVRPGMTVILGPGTTTEAVARRISGLALRVVTNSLAVARAITGSETAVALTGGHYRSEAELMVGPWTESNLSSLFADICFIGVSGISEETGYSVTEDDEASCLRCCIRVAKKAVIVVDSSKFRRVARAVVAPLAAAHTLVSDGDVPAEWLERLAAAGVEVITAEATAGATRGGRLEGGTFVHDG
jgi:DeoR family transcriptional regulator, fructose operon transcriptional repressor